MSKDVSGERDLICMVSFCFEMNRFWHWVQTCCQLS